MREPNIPALRKTMEFIEANPDGWDQDTWASKGTLNGSACGSTMCFAGTTVFLAGAKIQYVAHPDHPNYLQAEHCVTPEGSMVAIEDYATELLGLTDAQADDIFYSDSDMNPQEMRAWVEEIVGEKL